jgi:hypothetical protein
MKTTKNIRNRKQANQGMNWIRQEKRLAIYLRDGLACAYCGTTVENGAKLTLDHIIPHSKGGSNSETNLVTCCLTCNSARGNRSMKGFAVKVAGYLNHGITAECIIKHISNCRKRVLPVAEAKELIARRGTCAKAIYN